VPEPRRLLEQWAEKYRKRYGWRLRSSFQTNNPFGRTLEDINPGLKSMITTPYVFSGAMAASDVRLSTSIRWRSSSYLPARATDSSEN